MSRECLLFFYGKDFTGLKRKNCRLFDEIKDDMFFFFSSYIFLEKQAEDIRKSKGKINRKDVKQDMEEKKEDFRKKIEDVKEYYEIRLESIGGLGANLCGKMLGELGIRYLGVNSSNFSSYGSEKTGTPVKGFIRYCRKEKEIRLHSPIIIPDLLVVFHQALLKDPSVWRGCHGGTKVLVALENGYDRGKLMSVMKRNMEGVSAHDGREIEIYGLEAQKIAIETKSRINVVMMGAILKIMGLDSPLPGERICMDTLGKKYPSALENNLEGVRRGYQQVGAIDGIITGCGTDQAAERKRDAGNGAVKELKESSLKEHSLRIQGKEETGSWGYLNAPIGGINPRIGSTVVSDLSPSRQGYVPIFKKEKCINCGLCFSTCPDMVFQFKKGEYKGIKMMINEGLDYYHCKGCLRCVEVCPVNALVKGEESGDTNKKHFVPNQELLRNPGYYEETGADGYITSESYLTEKRMEGGEV